MEETLFDTTLRPVVLDDIDALWEFPTIAYNQSDVKSLRTDT
jgi:hypothetical protein